jgi:hypothetical protein
MDEEMLGGEGPQMDSAPDFDQQISDGVQAFVNSGDPAIAVEVCNMLAQQMGLAPEQDFFGDQGADPNAAATAQPSVEAARGGTRIYRKGGKIAVKKLAMGGLTGPGPGKGKTLKSQKNASAGPRYFDVNPIYGDVSNQLRAEQNITRALDFKRNLRGIPGSEVMDASWVDPDMAAGGATAGRNLMNSGIGASVNYLPVTQRAIQQADSVLATRPVVNAGRARIKRK